MQKNKRIVMIGMCLFLAQTAVIAAEEQRSNNNLGYVVSNKAAAVSTTSEQPALVSFGARTTGTQAKSVTAKNGCFNCTHPDFKIFDSRVSIWGDDDADGFYRSMSVTFDVDTYGPGEWVYTRLFLSYEGGPWNEYAVTDDFYIQGIAADDNYVIETDLLSGYPTGFYDVLIEVYAARDGAFLTLSGPNEDLDLSVLALEDVERDRFIDDNFHVQASHGGSLSLTALFLLLLTSCRVYSASTNNTNSCSNYSSQINTIITNSNSVHHIH